VKSALQLTGPHGRIELPRAALVSIVVQATGLVAGARVRRPRRGLEIELDGDAARVEVGIAAPLGSVLPELGAAVQREVAEALRTIAGLERVTVDVVVEELE
jgi:uncharacterized alkaline shock family protein YloU